MAVFYLFVASSSSSTLVCSSLYRLSLQSWSTCQTASKPIKFLGWTVPLTVNFIALFKLRALNSTTVLQGNNSMQCYCHGDNTFNTVCGEESNVSGLQGVVMGTVRWPGLGLWFTSQGWVVHLDRAGLTKKKKNKVKEKEKDKRETCWGLHTNPEREIQTQIFQQNPYRKRFTCHKCLCCWWFALTGHSRVQLPR